MKHALVQGCVAAVFIVFLSLMPLRGQTVAPTVPVLPSEVPILLAKLGELKAWLVHFRQFPPPYPGPRESVVLALDAVCRLEGGIRNGTDVVSLSPDHRLEGTLPLNGRGIVLGLNASRSLCLTPPSPLPGGRPGRDQGLPFGYAVIANEAFHARSGTWHDWYGTCQDYEREANRGSGVVNRFNFNAFFNAGIKAWQVIDEYESVKVSLGVLAALAQAPNTPPFDSTRLRNALQSVRVDLMVKSKVADCVLKDLRSLGGLIGTAGVVPPHLQGVYDAIQSARSDANSEAALVGVTISLR